MATLQDKVEGYIGSFSDTASLTSWLSQTAHRLVDNLPSAQLELYSEDLSDGGSGVALDGYRVLRAHKSGYGANYIDPAFKSRVVDTGSIYKATNTSPKAYIENGKGYILPSGGTFIAFQYPTIGATTIAGSTQFLTDFEDFIVLPVAIKATEQDIATAEAKMKTYIETEEDFELAQATSARLKDLTLLLDRLRVEYDNLIKK